MASLLYDNAKAQLLQGNLSLTSSTIKAMLVSPSYSPSASDQFVSAANAAELSGTGYVAGFNQSGRQTLSGKSVSVDSTNHKAVFTANNLAWPGINAGTIAAVVLIQEKTSDNDSLLIAYLDPADLVTNGGEVDLQWNASGILRW
jgi:hypothetical protein